MNDFKRVIFIVSRLNRQFIMKPHAVVAVLLWIIIDCLIQVQSFRSSPSMARWSQSLRFNAQSALFERRRQRRNRDDYDDDYDPFSDEDDEERKPAPKPKSKPKLRVLTAKTSAPTSIPSAVTSGTIAATAVDTKPHFYSRKTLKEIGLNDRMVSVAESLGIVKPSKVQALSFPPIYAGKSCIIGDQTGSGKTLAYLLPILQRMDELFAAKKLNRPGEKAPFIIIMTPTTELAE